MLALSLPFGVCANDLSDARKEKEALETELQKAQALINDLKNSKEDIQEKVTQLDGRLTEISEQISKLETELTQKQAQISTTEEELETVQAEEAAQYESMKKRIRFMYENSQTSYVSALLSAENFADFLNAVEYISQIAQYDREMLERYEETKDQVVNAKTNLEKEKNQLQEMQAQVADEQEAVKVLVAQKESELTAVSENMQVLSTDAAAMQAEIQAQEDLIAQIQAAEAAKKAKREAAEKAAAEKAAAEKAASEAAAAGSTEMPQESADSGDNSQSQEDTDYEEDTYDGGVFSWPCPASRRVTSDFGTRLSPTAGASSNHKGIDIGAPFGSAIAAAADGTVIAAAYSSGSGNYVMIDHGSSLYTVYMHASSLDVSAGQKVTKGQTIAKVGSTGISTGNHLHFGVSLNGSYVSPWNYLSR